MKVLIAPALFNSVPCSLLFMAQAIASLCLREGHSVVVSAPEKAGISGVSLIPSPAVFSFPWHGNAGSCEEWLARQNGLSRYYLERDFDHVEQIIREEHPDLIFSLMRPSASIMAQKHHIRCFAWVHPEMMRPASFPMHALKHLNHLLSAENMVQILSLRDLWTSADLMFGYGPASLFSFRQDHILRIGAPVLSLDKPSRHNRICLFLEHPAIGKYRTERLIKDTFQGAPYIVYAWYPGSHRHEEDNIHFLASPDAKLIPGSIAVIHDGSTVFTTEAMIYGILQICISRHDFIQSANARAVRRSKAGIVLDERQISISSLYQSCRTLLSDDQYDIHAQGIREETLSYGGLERLTDFF